MRHRFLRAGAAVLAPLALCVLSLPATAQKPDSAEVTQLLNRANTEATQLATEAGQLQAYTRSAITWQSHANQLNTIKSHVNTLGKTLQEMQDKRDSASEWQQSAIDHIVPLAKELADDVGSTIDHLNSNKSKVQMPPYPDYAKANAETASDLSALIRDYVKYGKSKANYDRLGQKLEAPGH